MTDKHKDMRVQPREGFLQLLGIWRVKHLAEQCLFSNEWLKRPA
jgi:hypothetical protein